MEYISRESVCFLFDSHRRICTMQTFSTQSQPAFPEPSRRELRTFDARPWGPAQNIFGKDLLSAQIPFRKRTFRKILMARDDQTKQAPGSRNYLYVYTSTDSCWRRGQRERSWYASVHPLPSVCYQTLLYCPGIFCLKDLVESEGNLASQLMTREGCFYPA